MVLQPFLLATIFVNMLISLIIIKLVAIILKNSGVKLPLKKQGETEKANE